MKDIAILENELVYMTVELATVKAEREFLMRFLAKMLNPEDYGWLVDNELRAEIRNVLQEVQRPR